MKVLVTGGSGFIGQYCLKQLHEKGYEVHAVSSVLRPSSAAVRWHQASLIDVPQTQTLVRKIKPSHLLHLAWYTKHGRYWTAPENLNWVQGSLALVQEFGEIGGARLVVAGTCAEYDWSSGGVLSEDKTPLVPATLYGTYKHALNLMLNSWCKQNGLSSAWGRIFSIYGPGEYRDRLVASAIRSILIGQAATCGNPKLIRDYSHAEDVGSAFVSLLESDLQGSVNIGSGDAVTLGELVKKIAVKLDQPELVEFGPSQPPKSGEPEILLPEIKRLLSTGWKKKFDLDSGLNDTISWWKSQA